MIVLLKSNVSAGYSECGGRCVDACPATFTLNDNCGCDCGEGEISMWSFRYLNVSSQFAAANPDNGYDISKKYVQNDCLMITNHFPSSPIV